jgi:hypothetical protein
VLNFGRAVEMVLLICRTVAASDYTARPSTYGAGEGATCWCSLATLASPHPIFFRKVRARVGKEAAKVEAKIPEDLRAVGMGGVLGWASTGVQRASPLARGRGVSAEGV